MRSEKENAWMEMQKHGQDEQDEQDSGREEKELTVKNIGCAMEVQGALGREVQLVNRLTATGIEMGLPLNSVARRLEYKRWNRIYNPKQLP